jgi:hypothetical protein
MPENHSLDRVIFDDLVVIGVPLLVGWLLTVGTPDEVRPREETAMETQQQSLGERTKEKAFHQAAEDREALRRERGEPKAWTPEAAIERHRREVAGQE